MKLPHHPLDQPGVLKILLGQTASDLIAAHGDRFFAVVSHPDCTAPPEAAGRMILSILPVSKELAADASSVALGLAIVRPVKRAKQPIPNA